MVVSAISEGSSAAESDAEVLVRPAPAVRVSPPAPPTPKVEASIEFVAPARPASPAPFKPAATADNPVTRPASSHKPTNARAAALEESNQPVPLCNQCGNPLDRGQCVKCHTPQGATKPTTAPTRGGSSAPSTSAGGTKSSAAAQRSAILKSGPMALPPLPADNEIIELEEARPTRSPKQSSAQPAPTAASGKPRVKAPPLPPMAGRGNAPATPAGKKPIKPPDSGEAEFWKAVDT